MTSAVVRLRLTIRAVQDATLFQTIPKATLLKEYYPLTYSAYSSLQENEATDLGCNSTFIQAELKDYGN